MNTTSHNGHELVFWSNKIPAEILNHISIFYMQLYSIILLFVYIVQVKSSTSISSMSALGAYTTNVYI